MTATDKQKRCILALSHELDDEKMKWDDLTDLSKQDASEMIDKLRDEIDNGDKKKSSKIPAKQVINSAAYGMVAKVVMQDKSVFWVLKNPVKFKDTVKELYALVESVRAGIEYSGGTAKVDDEEVVM